MAHKEHEAEHKKLVLPISVTGPVEVGRLLREITDIDEALHQLGLREGGNKTKMPQTSRLMDKTIEQNSLNLLHDKDRAELTEFLTAVREKSPVLHMSFSADPSVHFLEKLIAWLRQEIHPKVLLTIGLQPNIGAGCILRTTNKQFDLSLRKDFEKKRDMLMASIVSKAEEAVR